MLVFAESIGGGWVEAKNAQGQIGLVPEDYVEHALGRSLASLVVACRQLWLSQARVLDEDKAALLDAPIFPGHTFGQAVEEILQRSHRERKVSQ
ncbi:UNVERIFIED_CONTAM: hypothetical protein FKN15_066249 [Acipenser sinensis]